MKTTYQITLPYACFGIEVYEDRNPPIVCTAAPIALWMIGKNFSYIKQWVTRKNGSINKLDI